jgi:hypothetical protein
MSTNNSPRKLEELRQLAETFNQKKDHAERSFKLRMRMGYSAMVMLAAILIFCFYVLLNYEKFTPSIVSAAQIALYGDIAGLILSVWKIVFNPNFITPLTPTINNKS